MFPLQTTVVSRHPAIVTWIVIGLNVLFFFFELQLPSESLTQLITHFGIVPARLTGASETTFPGGALYGYWPLVTSMFLHGGWAHIIGNMWTFWIFGQHVEDRMGPLRFLVFYMVCGLCSGVFHTVINAGSTVPSIGASGAISGVMAAYFMLFPKSRVIVMVPIFIFPLLFDFLAVFYIGYWFLLQLISGSVALLAASLQESGGIAFWAHVGGFLAGIALYNLFLRPTGERQGPYQDEGTYEHGWGS